ncbi:unnamed protein product [Effrenium voratum]|uniref:Pentatricopeptide repeat-containing protein n=1 Tax=Effrenium voratum TaxID=2562239 RepID=A0AA36ITY8_9DINO|nr:unnamed protein product [Effrenium voratum]
MARDGAAAQVVAAVAASPSWGRAAAALREAQVGCLEPDAAAFNALATRARTWQLAFHHFAWARLAGLRLSRRSLRSACASGAGWRHTLELLRLNGPLLSMAAVSSAAHAAKARWIHAVHLWGFMRMARLEPSVVTCNTLANAVSTSWQLCLEVLRLSKDARLGPDLATYSCGISACRWARGLHLASAAARQSLQANAYIYGSLLDSCALDAQWELAIGLVRRQSNPTEANSALSALEKGARWQRTLALLKVLAHWSVEIDCIACNVAIMSCRQMRKWREAFSFLYAPSSEAAFGRTLRAAIHRTALENLVSIYGGLLEASISV